MKKGTLSCVWYQSACCGVDLCVEFSHCHANAVNTSEVCGRSFVHGFTFSQGKWSGEPLVHAYMYMQLEKKNH